MSAFDQAKLLFVFAHYIAANFVPLSLPLIIFGAVRGDMWCQALTLVALLDFVVPLRPGPRGRWLWYCETIDTSRGLKSYFDAEIVAEGTLEKTQRYQIVYFPHSIFCVVCSLIAEYLYEQHGSILLFTVADVVFAIPLLRRMMSWWGCTSVSERKLKENLTLGYPHNTCMVQPDGIAGMFYGLRHEQIVLNRRRGFCRVAIQTGTSLVPCYCFGANQVYTRSFGPKSLAARLSSKVRMSLVIWTDRWSVPFGIVPYKTKLLVVMGKPIDVVQKDSPSKEEINDLHRRFVAEIKGLYDRHKHRMGEEWVREREWLYLESEDPEAVKAD